MTGTPLWLCAAILIWLCDATSYPTALPYNLWLCDRHDCVRTDPGPC